MMELIKQLPHIEPYGNPQYFLYVITAILPIFIGLFFQKTFLAGMKYWLVCSL